MNLYTLKHKPPPRFPNQRLEALWCTVHYRVPHLPERLKMRIYLVRGTVFTLAFGRVYRQIARETEVHIERVVFHADVMEPIYEPLPSLESAGTDLRESLPAWCTALGRQWAIERVLPPLSDKEQQRRLQATEAALPTDYLELVRVCEGFQIGDAVVLGLSEVREVWLSSGAYYLLAERGGGFLGAAEGERAGRVVYLHHEYSEPCAVFDAFAAALEHLLTRAELP
ncbi:MAG: hypothetical protein N2045_00075 [Fimbriimonadales bacterium]|nr:hypothetical protein [Fimbriimonadales bacterium]CUU33782.1 hypothetical protein GXSOP10_10820 [Armatimonadetes bacterium GXS]CUU37853.1 hypothetical protein DCOP10_1215 [Armatimonadetes bacterium DC]